MYIWQNRRIRIGEEFLQRQSIGRQKGTNIFTLIELLIIISMIAILAAMLLPVLNKAKEKAIAIKCVGNLKQMGIVWAQYISDNNDLLPTTSVDALTWPRVLTNWGYIGKSVSGTPAATALPKDIYSDAMMCPGWGYKSFKAVPSDWNINNFNMFYGMYTEPLHIGQAAGARETGFINLKKILRPSQEIIQADTAQWDSSSKLVNRFRQPGNFRTYLANASRLIHLRHSRKANLLMGDFHVTSAGSHALKYRGVTAYQVRHVVSDGVAR